ncbi:MAG: porin [Planctomycetota bacterium]
MSVADDTETNVEELRARLLAAEAKIAELETKGDENWLTEQRATEIRGLVHDVLADADTRASLMQSGMTAGYDNGAVIGSSDGNWLLRTNILMQQRFIYNNQEGDVVDSDRWGFENTRTKFILTGHVVNPDWFYRVDINVGTGGLLPTSPATGVEGELTNTVEDRTDLGNAYLGYDYGNGWKVMMGSMKAPFLREELVEAQYQLAVERSVLNYSFTAGYVDALALNYTGDQFRFTGAIHDGANSGGSVWSTPDTEWALAGRAEILFSGTWEQFDDFTSPPGSEMGIMLGVAGIYQTGESGTAMLSGLNGAGGVNFEVYGITIDASAEFGGFNLFAAFTYLDIDTDTLNADTSPYSLIVQGGFYLSESWELYARYEYGDPDSGGVDDVSLFTVGANYYFAGHNAKWTTDFGYGVDAVSSNFTAAGIPHSITGWRADELGEDGQWVIRTQLQLLF